MKTKNPTLKSENFFNKFKKYFTFKKNLDYVKHKNIFLTIFTITFVGLIGFLIAWFSLTDSQFYTSPKIKTTIEIPSFNLNEENLEDFNVEDVKSISAEILEKDCTVQLTETSKDLYTPEKGKLTITIPEEINQNDKIFKDKLNILIAKIKENYPKILNISNAEEIFVSKQETAEIDAYEDYSIIFIVCLILVLTSAYFIITFKKLNGFLIAVTFIFAFILNLVVVCGLFLAATNILEYEINNILMFALIITLTLSTLNLTFNTNFIFNKIKNLVANEKNKDILISKIANNAINNEIENIFNNFKVYFVLPTLLILGVNLGSIVFSSNINFLINTIPFLGILIISGIFSILISVLGVAQLWLTLKRKNKTKTA